MYLQEMGCGNVMNRNHLAVVNTVQLTEILVVHYVSASCLMMHNNIVRSVSLYFAVNMLHSHVNFDFIQVLGDVLIWTIRASDVSINCREVLHQKDGPSARFSHSAAVWRKETMVVTGGLDEDMLPLRDIWCFSLKEEAWHELDVAGMLPRYSHTSAICGDQLVLIGGVNTLPGSQPGVCVVDLCTASCTEYALPVCVTVCNS